MIACARRREKHEEKGQCVSNVEQTKFPTVEFPRRKVGKGRNGESKKIVNTRKVSRGLENAEKYSNPLPLAHKLGMRRSFLLLPFPRLPPPRSPYPQKIRKRRKKKFTAHSWRGERNTAYSREGSFAFSTSFPPLLEIAISRTIVTHLPVWHARMQTYPSFYLALGFRPITLLRPPRQPQLSSDFEKKRGTGKHLGAWELRSVFSTDCTSITAFIETQRNVRTHAQPFYTPVLHDWCSCVYGVNLLSAASALLPWCSPVPFLFVRQILL